MSDVRFELICEANSDGDIGVRKYKSKESGLQVIFADVDGPLVHGYLCFATEAKDDDGLPHTLEHLVFIGSEQYPWKGVLDLLANTCLASGTNAWTDTDHTCYTLCTAGEEGFLNMLPIYLDHLLNPLLTEEAFVTEVHHVNGDGEDGGVVYCEMQGRVNTGESLCHLAMLRNMYPGDCGYKSETGGLLENLRDSTTNEKCKAYHSAYYRLENMCILLVGVINEEKALKCLSEFESKIIEKRIHKGLDKVPFVRPWQSPVPPLQETCKQVVKFPSDTDDNGMVYVAWRGPSAVTEFDQFSIMSVLMQYLTETAVSPLRREFVEIEDAFCSDVGFSLIENSSSCVYLYFQSVPLAKLNLIEDKLLQLLNNIVKGTEKIDMKRMKTVIHRAKLAILSSAETSPHMLIASAVLGDFLYGNNVEDLTMRIRSIPLIESLFEKTADFWISFIKKYFVDSTYVFIIGEPSSALLKEMTEKEKHRIEAQRKSLGPNGLKEKEKILTAAKQVKEAPKKIYELFNTPSIEKLRFHSIERKTNYLSTSAAIPSDDSFQRIRDIPYRFQLDNLRTNFITLHVLLNTSNCIDSNLRLYLPLWAEVVTETAISRGGNLIPYQEIVAELAADTLYGKAFVGLENVSAFSCGAFAQMAALSLKVEIEKFEKAVVWLKELLYNTKFTGDRLLVVVKKMLNDIIEMRREGYFLTQCLVSAMNFDVESNRWAVNMVRQRTFLKQIETELIKSPENVIKNLEELREKITAFDNVTVHISVNQEKLSSVFSSDPVVPLIEKFIPDKFKDYKLENANPPFTRCSKLLRSDDKSFSGLIAGVGAVESSYLIQTTKSVESYLDPDYPIVLTLLHYFSQCEGPLYKEVRGKGLAYDASIYLNVVEGLLSLSLYRSVNAVEAYEETFNVINKHINGEISWEQSLLESAKSTLTFQLIQKERNVAKMSFESMIAYVKGIDMAYKKHLMTAIRNVTLDHLKNAAPKYLGTLFDPKLSRCAICCHPSKVKDFVEAMKKHGRQLQIIDLEKVTFIDVDLVKSK